MSRHKPVMMDVARLAGVSHQTVSRVLNGHPTVRPHTRERVLEAMRQLDYHRNSAARALVTNRSDTLGLITFDTTLFGPSSMVYSIERAAQEAGYFVSIASVRSMDGPAVTDAVSRLREQAVDGIVTVLPVDSALAALAQVPPEIPLVGVGVADATGVPMVSVDNAAGAALATQHLLELGHATVYHISGPAGWPETRQRLAGWRTALRAAGAAEPPVLGGDWSPKSGYEAARLLASDPRVTAIYCANDQMALGAQHALHEAGRAMPEQVSLVGFDDVPEAAYFCPPLSTVRQDFSALGSASLAMLLEQIATGIRAQQHRWLPPELVVRASSGPPPAR